MLFFSTLLRGVFSGPVTCERKSAMVTLGVISTLGGFRNWRRLRTDVFFHPTPPTTTTIHSLDHFFGRLVKLDIYMDFIHKFCSFMNVHAKHLAFIVFGPPWPYFRPLYVYLAGMRIKNTLDLKTSLTSIRAAGLTLNQSRQTLKVHEYLVRYTLW